MMDNAEAISSELIEESSNADHHADNQVEISNSEPYETIPQEKEFDEEDIVGYLVNEDGDEIGIIVLEDGEEVEYYYEDESETEPEDSQETIEFDEESIIGYIVDDEDTEIGIIVMEDGEEVEYYYAEEMPTSKKSSSKEYDLGITREGVASATKDVNAIARDGIKVANEFKGAFDDIKSALDFKSMFK